jgi:ribosome maturation factor RimP
VWDVEYSKIGTERHLEITIDSESGIDINDCEKVHRVIEVIIDEADPIEEMYYLDVSSPGLERNIRTAEHFEKCVGEVIEMKLFAALDGKKGIIGELIGYDAVSDKITVREKSGNEYTVDRKLVSKANVYFEL